MNTGSNIIDYDHRDDPNDVLFSHYSEDEEEEDTSPDLMVVDDDEPERVKPSQGMSGNLQSFLESCRAEAARIGTEQAQKEVTKRNAPSSTVKMTEASTGIRTKRYTGLLDKASPILRRTEAIRQRVIRESGGTSRGLKRSSNDDSAKASGLAGKGITWKPSFMPDAPASDAAAEPATVKSDVEEQSSEMTTNVKRQPNVYDKIKQRLQKKLLSTQSVVKVNGDTREVLLPVQFSAEEYIDQIVSSSYRSQELVQFHGKYVISIKHHHSAENGPKHQQKSSQK